MSKNGIGLIVGPLDDELQATVCFGSLINGNGAFQFECCLFDRLGTLMVVLDGAAQVHSKTRGLQPDF